MMANKKRGNRLDTQDFRDVLAQFATGVAVVVTRTAEGTLHGMTVNSFASVSLEPPLVLFCADNKSETIRALRSCRRFTVSMLHEEQEDLSRRFAMLGPQTDAFAAARFVVGRGGLPYLADSLAYVDARVEDLIPAGDHHIVLGRVEDLGVLATGQPLLFYASQYYRPVTLPPD